MLKTIATGWGAAFVLVAAMPLGASASEVAPVSRQKNVELNSVADNMGNYDSPPVTPPRMFARGNYRECLVALGSTYCRAGRHWLKLSD